MMSFNHHDRQLVVTLRSFTSLRMTLPVLVVKVHHYARTNGKGGFTMCVSYGCGRPNDKHWDRRNITLNDLDQAAKAAGTTRDRVVQNIMNSAQQESSEQRESGQMADRYTPKSEDTGTAWGQDQENAPAQGWQK